MKLDLRDGFHLSAITPADKPAYLEHLADKSVYENTCAIPYPYTEKDADDWIALSAKTTERAGRVVQWAIREPGGRLVGGIGFSEPTCANRFARELGYWLAKPWRGTGLMSAAVGRLVRHGFVDMGLKRVYAYVFETNAASMKVLERNGFALEGRLLKYAYKDSRFVDGRLYARVN